MRKVLWLIAGVASLLVATFAAMAAFPQTGEKLIEMSCSMKQPDENCQRRMMAMGHTWSMKGDLARAREWYGRVADLGDAEAMFHVGWTYHTGTYGRLKEALEGMRASNAEITPERLRDALQNDDIRMADKWYGKAVEKGFASAMNNLGDIAASGLSGAQDFEKAFGWYLAAARAGNPVAAINVMLAYQTGQGIRQDETEAKKWAAFVPDENSPDLRDFTLKHTMLSGMSLDPNLRSAIRNAAVEHKAVALEMSGMRPTVGLTTFGQISRQLNPPPREPTLKDLR
jgi:Sel1 repeat-containing protein